MTLDLKWDRPLNHRVGGATRLDGIDVYYDFDWHSFFNDERAQFRNGQCLAKRVRESCPEGKTPALLLTGRDDIDEGHRLTELHYVFVLNLPRYLRTTPDASLSYLASRLGPRITQLSHLPELVATASPETIAALIDSHLTLEHISAWTSGHRERLGQLRNLTRADDASRSFTFRESIAAAQQLEELDPEGVIALARLVGPGTNRQRRLEFLRRVATDPTGRYLTLRVLAERTADRVADAWKAVTGYKALLADPGTNETKMQRFIEKNPWLLGLDYARTRPRQPLLQGTMDFYLERFDGFHDLLELKSPQDPIIKVRRPNGESGPPTASDYALSPALAQALAQVHVYRELLTSAHHATEDIIGLRGTRDPRLIILIGRVDALPERSKRLLAEFNKSLHRVEVVPYDVLAKRAEAILHNVEKYLLAMEQ
ncbi:MAG: Shedu anti-phage system protein SduA domain-containing protein [Candidatus Dormibacteria bacterium]